ncbi:MAG: MMPL family transporter, partial [Frankia sp.]|nr:MMPL family transporter [Frankia sp.]
MIALITVLITGGLGFGLTRLEFTTGQDNYLNADSQIAKDNVAYQSLFGGQAMITVLTLDEGRELKDLFTPANIAKFEELAREVGENERIEAVITPLTALEFTDNLIQQDSSGQRVDSPVTSVAGELLLGARERDPDEASKATRLADSLKTLERVTAIPPAERVMTNPDWIDFLLYDNSGEIRKSLLPFFPNDRNAQIVFRIVGNASLEEEGQAAAVVEEAMAERQFDNATTVTTGAPVLLRDINDYLRGGFLTLGGIALALMAGLLLVAFAVRWRLLPLGVVAVGLVWSFGLAGYLGLPLSVVTMAGLPVLLGVGIDFAVQLHSRAEEEAQLDRVDSPVAEALRRLMPGLLLATVAAVVAFLALEFSAVPMIRDFGVLLAVGLPVIVLATVLLTSASLAFRERRSPTPPKDYTHGPLGRATTWLGSLPKAAAIPLMVLSVAALVGGVVAEPRLNVETDPEKWVSQSSQVIKDITELRRQTGSSSELGIYVQSDNVFDDETVAFVDRFAREQLDRYPTELLTASSIVTTVSFLLDVPGVEPGSVPPTGEDISRAYDRAPEAIQRSTVDLVDGDGPGGALNLIFRTGPGSLKERSVVVNDIRDSVNPPEGVRATPSGLAVVGVGLLDNFEKNRVELTYFALAAVFVVLLARYRSLVRTLLSMVPVLIAVGLTSLIAWAAGLTLSPMTAVGGPLVVALCTEFTALIVLRHLEERARGREPRVAAHEAAARTGRAFLVSAAAAVIGILVLATSPLPLLRGFGLVVALNVGVALLSALIVLPPLLVWADAHGWVYRPRRPGPVVPPPAPPAEATPA